MHCGIISAARRRSGGGGGATVRSSGTTSSGTSSVTVTFPAGTVAGDLCAISLSGTFSPNIPSGWFCLQQRSGSSVNGMVISKLLSSGDISTGSVTVTFAGSGSVLAEWIICVGAPIVHGVTVGRDIGSPGTLASWTDCKSGDALFWFDGMAGGSASPTIDRGTDVQVRGSSPWGRITSETLGSSGAVTATFTLVGSAAFVWAASVALAPPTSSTLAVRGTRITAFSGSSVAYAFPAGSQAGDKCIICVGHAFAVTTPTGWTQLDNSSGSFFNGAAFHKTLTSGDISTGSVTISLAGSFSGNVQGISFVGAPSSFRTTDAVRTGGTAAPGPTLTTDASPVAGDIALYFASCRTGTAAFPTVNRGSVLENNNNSSCPGLIAEEVLTASGAVSAQFGYVNSAASTSGDYTVIVVVTP